MMVALQSFSPIVSATQTHQVDAAHLQTEHSHQNDTQLLGSDNSEHDIKDCHHCGHCSGSHLSWLMLKETLEQIPSTTSNPLFLIVTSPIAFIEPTLRPPIA